MKSLLHLIEIIQLLNLIYNQTNQMLCGKPVIKISQMTRIGGGISSEIYNKLSDKIGDFKTALKNESDHPYDNQENMFHKIYKCIENIKLTANIFLKKRTIRAIYNIVIRNNRLCCYYIDKEDEVKLKKDAVKGFYNEDYEVHIRKKRWIEISGFHRENEKICFEARELLALNEANNMNKLPKTEKDDINFLMMDETWNL